MGEIRLALRQLAVCRVCDGAQLMKLRADSFEEKIHQFSMLFGEKICVVMLNTVYYEDTMLGKALHNMSNHDEVREG